MAEPPSDERELLRQLRRGNEQAFATVYERNQRRIHRFACYMSGNAATADEVTQEVFLQLIRNGAGYDPDRGTLAAYLLGMARNLLRRARERSRTDVALPEDSEEWIALAPAAEDDLLDEFDRRQMLDCLHKAVAALPGQYREAVVLCDLEQMSYADAADVLGCPAGTVASRLNRAHKMLRARLSRQGCTP
jgi:RNA polymerase sigma-70 factor, ECF subfamily